MNDLTIEKRKSTRYNSVLPVRIASEVSGETINLNETGISFLSEKPLLLSKMGIRIEFPFGDIIDIEINTIWDKRKENRFIYGACFTKLDEKTSEILQKALLEIKVNAICQPFDTSSIPLSSKLIEDLHPRALSVDITNTCNLRCKHCFWDSYDEQLPTTVNTNILDSVKNVLNKYPGITNITWFGGEPFAKEEIIELLKRGVNFKKNNLVITNGTFPIPVLGNNVQVAISVDGTKEINDKLRGAGVYDKIKKNAFSATEKRISTAIIYCLNAINTGCISEFLEEWSKTKIDGVVFTMYTPIKGKSSYLILNDEQREKTVSLLLGLKKKYGNFICNSKLMIELLRTKYGEELAENCPMNVFNKTRKTYCLHMRNDGNIRTPCAIGNNSSHLYCRSVTKVALYAGLVLKDKESFLSLIRMYLSTMHTKKLTVRTLDAKRDV
ncbi:MAG: radical SAM protein [Candidatus Omnitrophica bacterium]|nr:radical SAM protein [Candidatus Omnitrophota bacterium]